MKKYIFFSSVMFALLCLSACEKQNLPSPERVEPMLQRSEAYFENLRAYKKSDHQIYFGWFGGTGNAGNPDLPTIFEQIPDSVDIVSLWGGYPPFNSHGHQTMKKVQEQKGIRFVWCMFGSGVSNLISKNFPKVPLPAAIDSAAKSMADTLEKYHLDGFDLDYEPGEAAEANTIFGSNFKEDGQNKNVLRLFQALGKYMGPQSGTDKLLIIDGYSEAGVEPYYSYFMQQAYATGSPDYLQYRLTSYGLGECPPEKFVPCENFESYWETGGVNFRDPVRGTIPSLLGFAYWQPEEGRKGGAGAYHAEYEYAHTPDYKYLRQAIQIMNPAAN